jgi:hypothetical protein
VRHGSGGVHRTLKLSALSRFVTQFGRRHGPSSCGQVAARQRRRNSRFHGCASATPCTFPPLTRTHTHTHADTRQHTLAAGACVDQQGVGHAAGGAHGARATGHLFQALRQVRRAQRRRSPSTSVPTFVPSAVRRALCDSARATYPKLVSCLGLCARRGCGAAAPCRPPS